MKELTYQQIIEIAQREKALTVKNIASAIAGLIHKSTDEYGEYGEYEYEKDPRKKMRDLAQLIKDESITVFSDSNDYHNLAVDYARQELFDCAIWILKRGLKKYPLSQDLLADTILYGKESGQLEECENALSSLLLVDKESWGWRAYSFTIDYYLDEINRLPKGASRNKLKREIHKLADEFIEYAQRDPEAVDRAYCKKADVTKEIGGEKSQEEYLLAGYNKNPSAPQCALRLADMMFEQGEYSKVLDYLQKCKYAINNPQPDINPAYVYLLYAMSKTSKLMIETPDGNYSEKQSEIEQIYRDFHTAIKSFPINQTYENAARRTIKMLEIQTGINDRTPDLDDDDVY